MIRYQTHIKIAGTKSTRISASQLFGEFGGNITNPDKRIMEIFVADGTFVQPDQAGAEALVVAYESEPGNFRNLFIHGIKPHTWMAMHLFKDSWGQQERPISYYIDCPIAELSKAPGWKKFTNEIKEADDGKKYFLGKKVIHASNYRMGPRTFMMNALKETSGTLTLSYKECKTYLDTYKRLFPEVVEWQNYIENEITTRRKLTNLLGISREFHRQITDSYVREAISWIPQSTVGGITNDACIKNQKYIEENNKAWHLLSNKHDSYMDDVIPDNEVEECIGVMRAFMEVPLVGRFGDDYTMRTGISVGKVWAAFHKDKCPLGMREL